MSAAGSDVVSDRNRWSFALGSSSAGPRQHKNRIQIQLQPASAGDVVQQAARLAIGQALVWEFVLVFPRHPSIRGQTSGAAVQSRQGSEWWSRRNFCVCHQDVDILRSILIQRWTCRPPMDKHLELPTTTILRRCTQVCLVQTCQWKIELSDATGTWWQIVCPTHHKYFPLKLKRKHEKQMHT